MSEKSINLRLTIPRGVAISDHLERFPTGRARSHEIVRLAELALMGLVANAESSKGLSSSDSDPVDSNLPFTVKDEEYSSYATSEPEEKSTGVDFRGALDNYL